MSGNPDGPFSFVLSEMAIFNRQEWSKTQQYLPGSGDNFNDPSSWSEPNDDYKGPEYKARYYVFDKNEDGGVFPVMNKGLSYSSEISSWVGKEHAGKWDTSLLTLVDVDDEDSPYLFDDDGDEIAGVQALTGTDEWISNDMLGTLMADASSSHASGEPLKTDAILYSSNSIYGIVPKSSPMGGRMIVNGAILSADVGLLVGNGIDLNYDKRVKESLKLEETGQITLTRKMLIGRSSN